MTPRPQRLHKRIGPILSAGLLAAALCHPQSGVSAASNGASIDWSKAESVTMIAVDYEFKPNHLSFRVGVPYRLHLENHGEEMHELTAPDFFHEAQIENPDVLAREGTDLVVQPHETKDLLFVPRKAGHYDFVCADHDWAGMTGEITVD